MSKEKRMKTKKMSKKAQLEILGLAIIVILITLGILFVIKFVVLKEPTQLRKSYMRTEMASNMLNALVRTDTDCRRKSVTELLQDCANNPRDSGGGSIVCETGEYSCEFVNNTIHDITDQTFGVWNIDYELLIWLEDGESLTHILEPDATACKGAKESKPFYIPLDVTSINLRLDLCD